MRGLTTNYSGSCNEKAIARYHRRWGGWFKVASGKQRKVFSMTFNFEDKKPRIFGLTIPKTNMDTQNDGLGKVTPFKNGNFWYLC